jgi:hypothetical protein
MTDNRSPIEKNSPDDSGWGECPPGEISGMLNRLSRQRKLAASAKISAVAAALLVGAGIWQTLPVWLDLLLGRHSVRGGVQKGRTGHRKNGSNPSTHRRVPALQT